MLMKMEKMSATKVKQEPIIVTDVVPVDDALVMALDEAPVMALDEAPIDAVTDMLVPEDIINKKRQKHNEYMRHYRAHQRLLPTYAGLLRYKKSPISFDSSRGMLCNAQIIDKTLVIRIQHGPIDTGMLEQREFTLPDTDIKKFVNREILSAYRTS